MRLRSLRGCGQAEPERARWVSSSSSVVMSTDRAFEPSDGPTTPLRSSRHSTHSSAKDWSGASAAPL